MASLFVIQGADQGKRFELNPSRWPWAGTTRTRSGSTIPRSPAATPRSGGRRRAYRIVDLGSANGTFVNGQPIDQAPLNSGDRLQLGQTVMLFNEGGSAADRDLTARVDMLGPEHPDDRSAILKSIPAGEGSRVLKAPTSPAAGSRTG